MFSVIIPSLNVDNLRACIGSVKLCETECRVIVVDDCPGYAIRYFCLDHKIERSPGIPPFIFARNINIGIRAAGSNDVILLNDDALLQTPGGFSLLAREAEAHPEFGIISSTCNNTGNRNQWPQKIGLREESRQVCFIAVYIPRRTIETVGLLDERFVGYGMDDDDYSFRVRAAGLKLGIHDGCYVDHGSLTSSYRGGPTAGGDFRPNMKRFIEKWGTDNWNQPRETSQFAELFP